MDEGTEQHSFYQSKVMHVSSHDETGSVPTWTENETQILPLYYRAALAVACMVVLP